MSELFRLIAVSFLAQGKLISQKFSSGIVMLEAY